MSMAQVNNSGNVENGSTMNDTQSHEEESKAMYDVYAASCEFANHIIAGFPDTKFCYHCLVNAISHLLWEHTAIRPDSVLQEYHKQPHPTGMGL